MLNRQTTCLLALLLWAVTLPGVSAQTSPVEGTVRDASGAVIADATVVLNSGTNQSTAKTDADGHFRFATVSASSGTLKITREGFETIQQSWNAESGAVHLEIVLRPASANEQVTVSAARTEVRLSESLSLIHI